MAAAEIKKMTDIFSVRFLIEQVGAIHIKFVPVKILAVSFEPNLKYKITRVKYRKSVHPENDNDIN